ncbi:hypothetical protein LRF89_06550 [Halorhodospira sp. 9621]|uniref:hypothetical protein n=1 Tax=Halorhodospira sp. 9621 TaxID=2899135 RepID=UPI001EE937B6|nr:hypothetical protein [Halorhodospira sp. 9621]MCG5533100.1 hypothetical protein [Halorhodospira sp. 9621]
MEKIDTLLRDVLPEAPGCPKVVALNAVRHALNEWLRDGRGWQVRLTLTPAGDGVYEFEPLEGSVALALVHARDQDGEAVPARFAPPKRVEPEGGEWAHTADVLLGLAEQANEVPGWLLSRGAEAIAAGAKARLLVMPGVEWSAPELGMHYRALYRDHLSRFQLERARNFTTDPIRTAPARF